MYLAQVIAMITLPKVQATKIVGALVALLLLGSCYVVPVSREKAAAPAVNLDALRGSKITDVRAKLGKPYYDWSYGDTTYFVYAGRSGRTEVPVMVWLPVWAETEWRKVECLLVEFEDDVLTDFKRETFSETGDRKLCLGLIYEAQARAGEIDARTPGAPAQVDAKRKRQALKPKALQGDRTAAWTGYRAGHFETEAERVLWLCLAAHAGKRMAQSLFGFEYESIGSTPGDLMRSYMWQALAGPWWYPTGTLKRLRNKLTAEQLAEAERMVATWKPAPKTCEAEAQAIKEGNS
jgi:hypothetical protein